jgi:hypothetical protein
LQLLYDCDLLQYEKISIDIIQKKFNIAEIVPPFLGFIKFLKINFRLVMKNIIINILYLLFIIAISSCNPVGPDNTSKLSLTVEDVSCTEAWLRLSTEGLPSSSVVNINRDGKPVAAISSAGNKDTTIYIDSLLPNKTYTFQAIANGNSAFNYASEKITATTMDTTNHNFTWQKFTFGQGVATCDLRDVAIINEKNVWAVGAIYLKDSLGNPDPQTYNAVHWDGERWELKKIPYYYEGIPYYGPIHSVFAYGEDDVWFGIGNMIHFDGKNFYPVIVPTDVFHSLINKIWGNDDYFYIVGNNGNIARYYRKASVGGWQKIETGIDLDILDIWGNGNNIICAAGRDYQDFHKKIFLINGLTIKRVIENDDLYFIRTLWFKNIYKIILAGTSIFSIDNIQSNSLINEVKIDRVNYALNSVRGNDINDIFIAGAFGEVLHFNGVSWKSYIDETYINGNYYKISVKGDVAIAVGLDNPNAVIAVGIRNK